MFELSDIKHFSREHSKSIHRAGLGLSAAGLLFWSLGVAKVDYSAPAFPSGSTTMGNHPTLEMMKENIEAIALVPEDEVGKVDCGSESSIIPLDASDSQRVIAGRSGGLLIVDCLYP